MRPYDIISRLLTRHGGRAALLARLGPEAEDGIDELLSQALTYETVETPSLTGFLVWLAGDDVEVKRQLPGGAGGLIRIMTVHGSKGLESPVVILPETKVRRPDSRARTARVADMPVWRGSAGERPDSVSEAVDAQAQRQDEERRRLLYVAMTRAESWLIVAAAGETGAGLDSWYAMIAEGADRAALTRSDIDVEGIGTGLRLSFGDWPAEAVTEVPLPQATASVPDWARSPAPLPPALPRPVAASALGGAKVLAAPVEDADPVAAMLRGTRLHLLLEHLPGSPEADWPDLARAALAGAEGGLPDAPELAALLTEAGAVIRAPDLAEVMDPAPCSTTLREVRLTATLPGIGILHGTIDRLVISDTEVLAIDYKTNTEVPAQPEATPEGILRQMAAYRAALRLIYPRHQLRTAILWTATRNLMVLPDQVLDKAIPTLDPMALRP